MPPYETWRKSVKNRVLKNISAGCLKIRYLYLDNPLFSIPLLKFDRQSLSSRVITILDLTSSSLTLSTKNVECYAII